MQKDATRAIEIIAGLIEVGRDGEIQTAVDALPGSGYGKVAEKRRKSMMLTDHPAKEVVEGSLVELTK